jgi:hypothetical protein
VLWVCGNDVCVRMVVAETRTRWEFGDRDREQHALQQVNDACVAVGATISGTMEHMFRIGTTTIVEHETASGDYWCEEKLSVRWSWSWSWSWLWTSCGWCYGGDGGTRLRGGVR